MLPRIMSRPERVRAGEDATGRVGQRAAMGAQRSTTGSARQRSLQSVWRTGVVSPRIRPLRMWELLHPHRFLHLPSSISNSSNMSSSSNNSSSNRSLPGQALRLIRRLSWPARTAVQLLLRYGAGMKAVIPFAMLAVSPIKVLKLLIRSYDGRWGTGGLL